MPAHEFLHPDQFLYHSTDDNHAESIMQDKALRPSHSDVIAGASGIYFFGDKKDTGHWGESHVIVAKPNKVLKIHPNIDNYPKLARMRQQNQFANDWNEDGSSHNDTIATYRNLPDDLKFPLTQESADSARDVSEHLQKRGFHGHRDSLLSNSDIVIYNPEDLDVVRHLHTNQEKRPRAR